MSLLSSRLSYMLFWRSCTSYYIWHVLLNILDLWTMHRGAVLRLYLWNLAQDSHGDAYFRCWVHQRFLSRGTAFLFLIPIVLCKWDTFLDQVKLHHISMDHQQSTHWQLQIWWRLGASGSCEFLYATYITEYYCIWDKNYIFLKKSFNVYIYRPILSPIGRCIQFERDPPLCFLASRCYAAQKSVYAVGNFIPSCPLIIVVVFPRQIWGSSCDLASLLRSDVKGP